MQITNDWIRGFVDGEGCFYIQKIKKNGIDTVRHRFIVTQDQKSVNVLYALKTKLKCGGIHKNGKNMRAFQVSNKNHIQNIIIPFFTKNPLLTQKKQDFLLFADSFNQYNHCNLHPYQHVPSKTLVLCTNSKEKQKITDGWIRGFIDGEGCFCVSMVRNYPRPQLIIGLHEKEKHLLLDLKNYLNCGNIRKRKDGAVIFQVTSSKSLSHIIFPLLVTKGNKVLLKTSKRIGFQKFKKIVELILQKQHLTEKGSQKIMKLRENLNPVKTPSVFFF